MAEALAENKEEAQKPELSPEELKKEEAAAELLKEIEEEQPEPEPGAEKKEEEPEKGESEAESDAESERDSQPEKATQKKKGKSGFKKRQARLVKQRDEARGETSEIAGQLEAEKAEKQLLKMRIQQLENAPKPLTEPDPESFDGGEIDPDYVKAKKEFDDAKIKKIVRESVAEATQQGNQTAAKENHAKALKQKQDQHWEKADNLGVSDYDEAEEEVVKVMGPEMVNNIIDYFPEDSHKVIYYLGKNSDEAEDIAEMLADKSRMVKGVAEIGRIIAKQNLDDPITPTTPDPDEETEGSAPSHQEALQQKLDKLRDDAAKFGRKDGMKKILAFKRKARERGITLR